MASWGFEVSLKATAPHNFSQGRLTKGASAAPARELLRDLTLTRKKCLNSMSNLSSKSEDVVKDYEAYVGLLKGLVSGAGLREEAGGEPAGEAQDEISEDKPKEDEDGPSSRADRMRHAEMFKWTDYVSGKPTEACDAQFELLSITINLGLWYMNRAAYLTKSGAAGKEVAIEAYQCLRKAAGVFEYLSTSEMNARTYFPDTDVDQRVLTALSKVCLAEAQEVTTDQAQSKGHSPEVVAGLARDNMEKFTAAQTEVDTMEVPFAKVLSTYLGFKKEFYHAYALAYLGQKLHSEEECGKSLRALKDAQEALQLSIKTGKLYAEKISKFKRHGMYNYGTSNPAYHARFQALEAFTKKTLDTSERENGFIYHHPVSPEDPELLPAKTIATPEPFSLPPLSEQWEKAVFEEKKIPPKGKDLALDKASSDAEKIQDPKKASSKDETYCVVS